MRKPVKSPITGPISAAVCQAVELYPGFRLIVGVRLTGTNELHLVQSCWLASSWFQHDQLYFSSVPQDALVSVSGTKPLPDLTFRAMEIGQLNPG